MWLEYTLLGWPANWQRLDLLLALLAAHLLGDFVFQTGWMVRQKRRFAVLALHAGVVAALTYLLAARWTAFSLPLITWVSHMVIDAIKVRASAKGAQPFVIDQLAHLAVVGLLALWAPHFGSISGWVFLWGKNLWIFFAVLSGSILTVRVGELLIGFWVQPYLDEIQSLARAPESAFRPVRGLTNGGRLIGQWERALIFLFVGLGQLSAIGFLIAAKSVFRFGELKERENRMEAEYITIGTLMSFGWAVAISYSTWWLVSTILAMR
jgi:hypothetical protein